MTGYDSPLSAMKNRVQPFAYWASRRLTFQVWWQDSIPPSIYPGDGGIFLRQAKQGMRAIMVTKKQAMNSLRVSRARAMSNWADGKKANPTRAERRRIARAIARHETDMNMARKDPRFIAEDTFGRVVEVV